MIHRLEGTFRGIDKIFRHPRLWKEEPVGGSRVTVVYTAYPAGEIRQALYTLR